MEKYSVILYRETLEKLNDAIKTIIDFDPSFEDLEYDIYSEERINELLKDGNVEQDLYLGKL